MSQELPGMGLPPLPSVATAHLEKSHISLALGSSSVPQVGSLQASPGCTVQSSSPAVPSTMDSVGLITDFRVSGIFSPLCGVDEDKHREGWDLAKATQH